MSQPSLVEQIVAANHAVRREAALSAKRTATVRRDPGLPSARTRILQFLADGREHGFAEIIAAIDCSQSGAAWAICVLVRSGRVERLGKKKPFRYRIA